MVMILECILEISTEKKGKDPKLLSHNNMEIKAVFKPKIQLKEVCFNSCMPKFRTKNTIVNLLTQFHNHQTGIAKAEAEILNKNNQGIS